MNRWLAPHADRAYGLMRIVAGFMFTFHGVQKIFGVLSDHVPAVGSQIWVGGLIELIGGPMIMLGLFTSCAAFIASGTMAVAYIQFHWRFRLGVDVLPGINKGELAALYSVVFLAIACRGAGPFSVDSLQRARTTSKKAA